MFFCQGPLRAFFCDADFDMRSLHERSGFIARPQGSTECPFFSASFWACNVALRVQVRADLLQGPMKGLCSVDSCQKDSCQIGFCETSSCQRG